jgi:phosphoribosylformylglycinamidine synthase
VSGLTTEAELFGEGPGAFLVSGPADALAAFGGAARVIGTVGGEAVEIEGVLSVPLDELDRAFTYGLADLLH